MIRIRTFLLASRIEYHWWFILKYRKLFKWLHDHGEAFNSEKMLRINKRFMRRAMVITRSEKMYRKRYFPIVGGIFG